MEQATLHADIETPERPPVGRPLGWAFLLILFFFVGLGGWAALAPLDSAAVATAKVTVAGNRKSVQHLEGGIVRTLLVKEGELVVTGQPLLVLDKTQSQVTYDQLRARYDNLVASEARLLAERSASASMQFPDALLQRTDEEGVANAMAGEQAIFDVRKNSLIGRKRIMKKRVDQIRKEIESLESQVASETRQLELIREEKQGIEKLFETGNIDKPRLLAAQREEARIEGSLGEHTGLIARAEQRIGETELEMIDLENRFLNQVLGDLKDVQANLTELIQRLKAAEDVLERNQIVAPVGGTIVGLSIYTEGAVISSGQRILDIVPVDDTLELEAEIDPNDIDVVRPGLSAQIRLTAYKQRSVPTLEGTVILVSADTFSDDRTGRDYFLARIKVDPAQLEDLQDVDLYPGMAAEVMIRTGEQTVLEYFLAPISHSISRAFRES